MEENNKTKIITVNENDFEEKVINQSSSSLVVVDFWAEWCMPCQILGPIIEQAVSESSANVILAKLNVDENSQISQLYQINAIPIVKFFKDGKVVDEFVGVLPIAQISEYIARHTR